METTAGGTATHFRLLILGDGTVRTVPLQGTRWFVGRATDCSIALRDPTVSRRHLLIERIGDEFRFQDLGGSNPVLIEGRVASQGAWPIGETLSVGMTRLTIERRHATPLTPQSGSTVVLSREVIDEELMTTSSASLPGTAARILDRIEWTFADLGDLSDAAEPLLTLAMNLSGRGVGWLGRFNALGMIDTLASVSNVPERAIRISEGVLAEARRVGQPHLLTTQDSHGTANRLVIPLGPSPDGIMLLESPTPGAPQGQELLRLARSLGTVVWHRLQETSERLRLRDELQRLRFHGSAAHNALLASARLNELRQTLRSIAGNCDPLLLIGEDGTEREPLARYLHAESPRKQSPFMAWDATRVPQIRHAKELLGDGRERGLVNRCSGGTLFLNNAESLSPAILGDLARALDNPNPPALVLAAATELDWPESIAERLTSNRASIPPLRSDPRDVIALAELFLSEMGCGPEGTPRLLTERSRRVLANYGWPGNVRELRLVLESAAAAAGNQPIAPKHLPQPLDPEPQATQLEFATLEEVERRHIAEVMARTGGSRARAAQLLGIATSTLYDKLKRYGIGS